MIKPCAARTLRVARSIEMGLSSTKFAPISKACWMLVLPLTTAKAMQLLLDLPCLSSRRTSGPFGMSSQSTSRASYLRRSRMWRAWSALLKGPDQYSPHQGLGVSYDVLQGLG